MEVGHLKGLGTLVNIEGPDLAALSGVTKTNWSTVQLYGLHHSVSMSHEQWGDEGWSLALEHSCSSKNQV